MNICDSLIYLPTCVCFYSIQLLNAVVHCLALQALATAVWSVLKAKRRMLKVCILLDCYG